jgi:hypothetical protein
VRKILLGMVTLAVAVSLFTIYSRFNSSGQIDTGTSGDFNNSPARNELAGSVDANQIGKIDDIGVGPVQDFKYLKYNENKEIESELGFKKLFHKNGNVWEVEQPFGNFYNQDFSCYMTADAGIVEVVTAGGKTTPKDLTFTGNVVIRILPGKGADISESYIFLDNISFFSDRSLYSTDGPVKFISNDIQMLGKGLDIIYNSQQQRLEYCRIKVLETLEAKIPQTEETKETLKPGMNSNENTTGGVQPAQPQQSQNIAVSQEPQQNQLYKCIFRKNVLIKTTEQIIYAGRDFSINNILFKQTLDQKKTSVGTRRIEDANVNDSKAVAASSSEPNAPAQKLLDITITCDDGITLIPLDSLRQQEVAQETTEVSENKIAESTPNHGLTKLITRSLNYDISTGDAFADGKTSIYFYPEDSNTTDPDRNNIEVTIAAQNSARFLKQTNQVIFDGNCLCTIPQKDLQKDATLSAAVLTANLQQGWSSGQKSAMPDITAAGPADLAFFYKDPNSEEGFVPVRISANKQIRYLAALDQVIFEGDSLCVYPSKEHIFSLKSPELTVNLPPRQTSKIELTDITAAGPAVFEFDIDDISGTSPPKASLPARIVAQKKVRLLADSKQVVFEGPCESIIIRDGVDSVEEFKLVSQTMTVDIPDDMNNRSESSPVKLMKHFTAEGGQVTLSVAKYAKTESTQSISTESVSGKLLSFITIQCTRLDYDGEEGMFAAAGPGVVTLKNQLQKDGTSDGNDSQWYAMLDNFKTLKYFPELKRIEADAPEGETLSVTYITNKNDVYSPVVSANVGHAEIELMETADGKTDFSKLVATGGIDYKDGDNRFIGSRLFYDHALSLITVEGDRTQPCLLNGAQVDKITYNPVSKKLDFKGAGIGSIPIP